MILHINIDAQSPQNALVHSRVHPISIDGPSLVLGDTIDIQILLVDGVGGYSTIGAEPGATLKVAVGQLPGDPIAFSDVWSAIANGWSGIINLNTAEAHALLSGEEYVSVEIEIELTRLDGTKRTIAQIATEIRSEMIPEAPVGVVGNTSYLTSAQVSSGFVHNLSVITSLTGGGATALDGLSTSPLALGTLAAVVLNSVVSFYQLISSTAPENAPWVVRPDDYNAGSPMVWVLRQQDIVGFTHDQSVPANTWSGVHGLGYRPAAIALYVGNGLAFADMTVDANNFVVNFGGNYSGQLRLR